MELKTPESHEWSALKVLFPKFLSYILSFTMVLIYWNNHHHLFQTVDRVNGKVLLYNGLLLFFLSLLPFGTSWMGENHYHKEPVIFMGIILFFCGLSYSLINGALKKIHDEESLYRKAIRSDIKGNLSLFLYAIAIPFSYWNSYISIGIYVFVAILWFIPDRRMEQMFR